MSANETYCRGLLAWTPAPAAGLVLWHTLGMGFVSTIWWAICTPVLSAICCCDFSCIQDFNQIVFAAANPFGWSTRVISQDKGIHCIWLIIWLVWLLPWGLVGMLLHGTMWLLCKASWVGADFADFHANLFETAFIPMVHVERRRFSERLIDQS